MSEFLKEPCIDVPGSSDAENYIRKIYHHHWQKMRGKLQETMHVIDNWSQTTVASIQNHAQEQMRILGEEYDRQRGELDRQCEESLAVMRSCYSAENTDLLNDMQQTWLALQFRVAELEFFLGTMTAPKVITIQEQMERANQQHANVLQEENRAPVEQPMAHSQTDQNAMKVVTDNRTLPTPNEAQFPSTTTNFPDDKIQSNEHHNKPQACYLDHPKALDKCPVCFMIFPSNMPPDKRIEHAKEHYSDG